MSAANGLCQSRPQLYSTAHTDEGGVGDMVDLNFIAAMSAANGLVVDHRSLAAMSAANGLPKWITVFNTPTKEVLTNRLTEEA